MDMTTTRTTTARPTAPVLLDAACEAVMGDPWCAPLVREVRAHAVEVACLARELATFAGADAGDAFAAGLLHELGELLLMQRDPVGYVELLRTGFSHAEQLREEKAAYRTDHPLLAAEYLLEQRVPDTVADAVADHHDPIVGSQPVTVVVAAADELLTGDPDRRTAVTMLERELGGLPFVRSRATPLADPWP